MTQSISSLRLTGILFLLSFTSTLSAQLNDECSTAIHIADPTNFCSPLMAGDNTSATFSMVFAPPCFLSHSNDLWYSFTAVASEVVIVVNGLSNFTSGGTLIRPGIALYTGSCPDGLTELGCVQDFFNNVIELHTSGLTPGQTYYFRVDGGVPGSFQYCIRNFFFGGEISGDCPTSVVVCDKSPFNVQAVAGPGTNPTELDDATCFLGFNGELNSTWFVWTAQTSGSLEFTLTPNNAADDLDFVLYRLPNGPGNCSGKIIERCMAAGDFSPTSPCMGPTGLNDTATDISQPPGCALGDDNFLQALQMVAGTTYGLVINNFTSSGNGFQVEWGGTSEFFGPSVAFYNNQPDNTICIGDTIAFIDSSFANNDVINGWFWNFGENATPDTVRTVGPNAVQYQTGGLKTIALSIHTLAGCDVTTTRQIQVDTCCNLSADVSVKINPDGNHSTATLSTQNGAPPFNIHWSDGQTDSIATNLPAGDYSVIVSDNFLCVDTVLFKVLPEFFEIPNVFTPNGDGVNDTFSPFVQTIEVLQIKVWSRWGELVYQGTDTGWDGKVNGQLAPSDVYAYEIVGRHGDGRDETRKGSVTLLR